MLLKPDAPAPRKVAVRVWPRAIPQVCVFPAPPILPSGTPIGAAPGAVPPAWLLHLAHQSPALAPSPILAQLAVQHRPPRDRVGRAGGHRGGRLGRRAAGRQLRGGWVPGRSRLPLFSPLFLIPAPCSLLSSAALPDLRLPPLSSLVFSLSCRRRPGQVHRVRLHLCRPGGRQAQGGRAGVRRRQTGPSAPLPPRRCLPPHPAPTAGRSSAVRRPSCLRRVQPLALSMNPSPLLRLYTPLLLLLSLILHFTPFSLLSLCCSSAPLLCRPPAPIRAGGL